MRFASASASRRDRVHGVLQHNAALAVVLAVALAVALAIALGACGKAKSVDPNERQVLMTKKGNSLIQVTESERSGNQIVRVRTVFQGEESTIELDIDQPVYEVELPLTLEQVVPGAAGARAASPEGRMQDLLTAQWLQKAQEAMIAGDYNQALRQVDTVLSVQPNNVLARSMKGSVYYALGNYELANQEWEYVLSLDPSNKEVLDIQQFLRNRSSGQPPRLPGAPAGTAPSASGAPPPPPQSRAPQTGAPQGSGGGAQ